MSLFIEVLACSQILEKWKANPSLTKREIGVWSAWKDGEDWMDLPLSDKEVHQMKEFLQRVAPTSYAQLFQEDTGGASMSTKKRSRIVDVTKPGHAFQILGVPRPKKQ